ncbi:MAG TPA: polysaccharide pyruvyl transferase family protein [Bacillota bacterium]|nr:polysaccharide pyruvyl transferase family protein [Bacillota bacterium]
MKIYTITCHDVYNAGASLQAYALEKYLSGCRDGNEVEIIDYKPPYLSNHYKLNTVGNEKYSGFLIKQAYLAAKLPGRLLSLVRKKRFDDFSKKYLVLTKEKYTSNEELKERLPEGDVYFAGSDQIWNTQFPNGRDKAFYLDFAPDKSVKASYAASFATKTVADEYTAFVAQMLSGLDFVSTREQSGVEIASRLGRPDTVHVLDPVFLLEKEEWYSLIPEKTEKAFQKPYIFAYDFDKNDRLLEFAYESAKKHGCELYVISSAKRVKHGKRITNPGPLEFLTLVKNAQTVVSNSFHATAFALIFNRDMYTFGRTEKINTRMSDLLCAFGLDDRMIDDNNAFEKKAADFSFVNEKLREQAAFSKGFIDTVLNKGIK